MNTENECKESIQDLKDEKTLIAKVRAKIGALQVVHGGSDDTAVTSPSSYDPSCFDDDNAKYGPNCESEGDCGDCINLRTRIEDGEDVSENCAAAAGAGKFCKKSCNMCNTSGN